jgi:transcriptional regulator with XRE-family HTH domain
MIGVLGLDPAGRDLFHCACGNFPPFPSSAAFLNGRGKLSKVTVMEQFGVTFGRLVREKRGIEGLSQDDLAERSALTKARISEIETGKVANPHARTVDALCVALNISREERARCYAGPDASVATQLPFPLLEKLARHFGRDVPDATEDELVAFLMAKAEEFREMRQRLTALAAPEGRISELINAANAAIGEGEFKTADDLLKEAETVQLQSSTIVVVKRQAQLRIERGNAALVIGDIETAVSHFERSSQYFSGIDEEHEGTNRHECATLLRYYGYRYRSPGALKAAHSLLELNMGIWKKEGRPEKWCQTKIALGGVSTRLSQFDAPENATLHLMDAKRQYEEVRAACADSAPRFFATAGLDLANVLADSRFANSTEEYEDNIKRALGLQLSAIRFISEADDPRSWGILQHNLGCSYINLANVRTDEADSAADIENAIRHLELSFRVRNPEESLQYWVASCRSLGEALVNMSTYSITKDSDRYVRRAFDVLSGAAARISPTEHPHQWAELQTQLAKCAAHGH